MLATCAKCGKPFYGVRCPECDFPPSPEGDRGAGKPHRLWGVLFLALGGFVALMPVLRPEAVPVAWAVVVAGVVFGLAGVSLLTEPKGRAANLLAGLVLAGLSSLGFFAAFGPGPIEGGIPLIPTAWNQALGRGLFLGGAILTAAFALWVFYRAAKPPKAK